MNMLALTWGETTIVVDAGVMFPDPELLGVDRIIPDLTYLQQKGRVAALVLTHGHEDHIGGVPHVLPLRRRPGLRHAADAGAGRAQAARSTASTWRARLHRGAAARPRHGRPVRDRVHPRHAQHSRLRRARHPHAGRRHRPHRRLQDRSDADRRRALRRAPLRRSSAPAGVLALFADSTNIDRRGFTGSELEVVDAFEEIFTQRHRPADRRGVRVEHLPDADSGRPGGAVRSQGRVRRPRHDRRTREIAQRLGYLRIPAGRADSRLRRRQLPGAGRAVPGHRLAGRADVGAVAHRDRRPPPREGRSRRHRGAVGARRFPATKRRSAASSTTSRGAAPT